MMSPLVASTENLLLAASPGLASWNTPSSDRRLYTSAELRLLSRSSATAVSGDDITQTRSGATV